MKVDNILLNYYPKIIFQEKNNKNNISSLMNYSIISHHIDYSIIKK